MSLAGGDLARMGQVEVDSARPPGRVRPRRIQPRDPGWWGYRMVGSGMVKKERIDRLMVRRGLADSREQAQVLIAEGGVRASGRPITKSSTQVLANAPVHVAEPRNPFASRGGMKLEAALNAFKIDPSGRVAMDVGCSTGGFTDCLLRHGAARVFAVDVGYGQLAWRLRQDPRVICMERTNIRYLKPGSLGCPVDLVTIDVSFISLKKVLPVVLQVLGDQGGIVALVKPQFELQKGEVGRGGIIREPLKRERAMQEVTGFAQSIGLTSIGHIPSPVPGKKGNIEYLLYLKKAGPPEPP